VERYGAFWCVFVQIGGDWQRMRDLYTSRNKARQDQYYWANY